MTTYYPSNLKITFDPIKGIVQEAGDTSTVTFASGSTLEVSGAFAYTAQNPGDWSSVPTDVLQAIDYLAAGSGSGGGGGGGGETVIADGGTITGTYEGNVLCKGNASLAGNVTVEGRLLVLGNLTNDSGYSLTVRENLVVQNMYFTHSDPNAAQQDITVDGDMFVNGALDFQQSGLVQAMIRVGGDLVGTYGAAGSVINAYGLDGNGGANIIVYGDMSGFSDVDLFGGQANATNPAGSGGNITIYGNYTGHGNIRMYGGNGSTFSNGGNGGNFECYGNIALGDYDLRMHGGSADDFNGGNGGNFSCDGHVSIEDLDLYGGSSNFVSVGGSGGTGGSINVNGNLVITNDIDAQGGSGIGASSYGGNGGSIIVDGSLTVEDDIYVYGGSCDNGLGAGGGGSINVYSDMSVASVSSYGGDGTNCSSGNGGSISVEGTLTVSGGSINLYGGTCTSTNENHTSGTGGSITCNTLISPDSSILINGGDRGGITTIAGSGTTGAASGNITVAGDLIADNIYMVGSQVTTTYKSFAGGNGGILTVGGSLTVKSDLEINGGNANGYDGGQSGQVFVSRGPANCSYVSIQGGASNSDAGGGPATQGTVRDSNFSYGINSDIIIFKDGAPTVGSTPATAAATLQIGGPCYISTLDVENRVDVRIKGTGVIPATLKLNSMPSKVTLNNDDNSATADITGIVGGLAGNIYATGGGNWYSYAGTVL